MVAFLPIDLRYQRRYRLPKKEKHIKLYLKERGVRKLKWTKQPFLFNMYQERKLKDQNKTGGW